MTPEIETARVRASRKIPGQPKWLDLSNTAIRMGIGKSSLSRMVKDRTAPPSVLVGRLRRFDIDEIDAFMMHGGKQ